MLETALNKDLGLLPYLTLGFFCGIRPVGELTLLKWSDVDLQNGIVMIRSAVSKMRKRFPGFSENAIAWLEIYRQRGGVCEGPIIACSERILYTRRQRIREPLESFIGRTLLCVTAIIRIGWPCIRTSTNLSSARRNTL